MATDSPLDADHQSTAAPPIAALIRTPDQRVRVFVSSTLDELAPERAAAREAITQLRLTPVFFEEVASYQKFSTPEELRERIANDLALLLTERFTSPVETPVAPRPAPLPLPRSRLIDREQELAQAKTLLQEEDVGLVTLTGPG